MDLGSRGSSFANEYQESLPGIGRTVSSGRLAGNKEPRVEMKTITPSLAEEFLKRNTKNRNPNMQRVNEYADDMSRGRWAQGPSGIGFDIDGVLVDGQQRLMAIVASGVSISMPILYNCPPESRLKIDNGKARTPDDVMKIHAVDAAPKTASILKAAAWGFSGISKRPKAENYIAWFDRLKDGVEFANEHLKGNQRLMTTAPVKGVVARAYHFYPMHRARLVDFCKVLQTGKYENVRADSGAMLLREWFIRHPGVRNGCAVQEQYRKTEAAIEGFMEQRDMERLYARNFEIFPINGLE